MSLDVTLFNKDIWMKVINALKDANLVEEVTINSFYLDAYIYELNEHKCIICCSSIVAKSVINSHSVYIKNEIENIVGLTDITLEILQEMELPSKTVTTIIDNNEVEELSENFEGTPVNKNLTFDNFIVGKCNKESHAAALACAISPGKFFNPVFIYGNSGLGKTHLLSAIANYINAKDPSAKVFYIGTSRFVEMVSEYIKNKRIEAFKKYMYQLDVLLIDDIQFLADK